MAETVLHIGRDLTPDEVEQIRAVVRPEVRKKQEPVWNTEPKPEDFDAALSFLTLMMPDDTAAQIVATLKRSPVTYFKAKDILRASKSGIDKDDANLPGVKIELKKIQDGESMNPVLLVQGSRSPKLDLVIADGFHRTHAAYANDDDAVIPAVLAKGTFDE